jgi:hypothetical protein
MYTAWKKLSTSPANVPVRRKSLIIFYHRHQVIPRLNPMPIEKLYLNGEGIRFFNPSTVMKLINQSLYAGVLNVRFSAPTSRKCTTFLNLLRHQSPGNAIL